MNDKYKKLFDELDSNNPRYIDDFTTIVGKILKDRDIFVKSSEEEENRIKFSNILKEILKELSVDDSPIEYLASGHSALAFKIGNKVIKIGKAPIDHKDRNDLSGLIPLFMDESYKIGDREYYTIKISPYVDTKNISDDDLYNVYYKLRKQGYIWNDPTLENVGRIIDDFDYNGKHYSKDELVVVDLEDIAYVGEITPDIVYEEISTGSYNRKTYIFETRYMKEHSDKNTKQK